MRISVRDIGLLIVGTLFELYSGKQLQDRDTEQC
jgi:hypothetical protein